MNKYKEYLQQTLKKYENIHTNNSQSANEKNMCEDTIWLLKELIGHIESREKQIEKNIFSFFPEENRIIQLEKKNAELEEIVKSLLGIKYDHKLVDDSNIETISFSFAENIITSKCYKGDRKAIINKFLNAARDLFYKKYLNYPNKN